MDILPQSRILKTFTDRGADTFEGAQNRLGNVRLLILVGPDTLRTAAGQACLLGAVTAAVRTYTRVAVSLEQDALLLRPAGSDCSIAGAIRSAGATIAKKGDHDCTHGISVGVAPPDDGQFWVSCYWNRWTAGLRAPWDHEPPGESWNPLAGAFAGALAVRQTFEHVLGGFRTAGRSFSVDMWNIHSGQAGGAGPEIVYLPKNLLLVGLGHLGQGFLWNLMQLPGTGDTLALQDYQRAGMENLGTGVLTRGSDLGRRKTRVALQLPELLGWQVAMLDMPFDEGMHHLRETVSVVVSGLDSVLPRQWIREAGYQYMLDIGVGHGAVDFEIGQLRVLPAGAVSSWTEADKPKNVEALRDSKAYADQKAKDQCGAYELAQASVAVPFVGLVMGALAVTQLLRLGAMEPTPALLQIELGEPEMATAGELISGPKVNIGTREINLRLRAADIR
ncbi:ThiF family adenylyltransferase [Ramlibacter ginsenosidimutans]|uniref:ThiF family adenylyltransferase n=1 Tax=Ramlibacter ginsenosidimutans TaxID=502333 RepID=A0A934TX13_9BURK|nr:ThiF family adenylyltransferase [Ramlibacter ginsenosidimutans]MBK6008671.1 ThiF family adenylyltransferase [Ramlibacter ginsenosidimutans]